MARKPQNLSCRSFIKNGSESCSRMMPIKSGTGKTVHGSRAKQENQGLEGELPK